MDRVEFNFLHFPSCIPCLIIFSLPPQFYISLQVRMEAACLPVDAQGVVRDVQLEELGGESQPEEDEYAGAEEQEEGEEGSGEEQEAEEEGREDGLATVAQEAPTSLSAVNPLEDEYEYVPEINALSPPTVEAPASSYAYTAPGRGASPNPNQAKTVNRCVRVVFAPNFLGSCDFPPKLLHAFLYLGKGSEWMSSR